MKGHVFAALIEKEGNGYNVVFPDLPNCYTCADDLPGALTMAEDVLAMCLIQMEDDNTPIPTPSYPKALHSNDAIVTLVKADTLAYRKRLNKQAVKKTLSIPQWMNEAAEKQGINFSQTLQEALMDKLKMA
ncbi:MAG: type II toxin-antitoxin system HicB family antitoxin [Clostridiales bacterium]|mgnify:CR=1 FL=1|nr:type II toxin-antitoxin system HicB family antitoxin [Clostridiales bacterium]